MVVEIHTGHRMNYEGGGVGHVYVDEDGSRIVLAVENAAESCVDLEMTPDEAVHLAVLILRERNLAVTGHG